MERNESQEDYLEAILQLSQTTNCVKSIDVANFLSFSKPSVSIAIKKLKEKSLITVMDDGELRLTKEGHEIAFKTLEKHEFFTNLFIEIGVSPDKARQEACSMEHSMSEETFEKFKSFILKK